MVEVWGEILSLRPLLRYSWILGERERETETIFPVRTKTSRKEPSYPYVFVSFAQYLKLFFLLGLSDYFQTYITFPVKKNWDEEGGLINCPLEFFLSQLFFLSYLRWITITAATRCVCGWWKIFNLLNIIDGLFSPRQGATCKFRSLTPQCSGARISRAGSDQKKIGSSLAGLDDDPYLTLEKDRIRPAGKTGSIREKEPGSDIIKFTFFLLFLNKNQHEIR